MTRSNYPLLYAQKLIKTLKRPELLAHFYMLTKTNKNTKKTEAKHFFWVRPSPKTQNEYAIDKM